jgi:hypothetical protein
MSSFCSTAGAGFTRSHAVVTAGFEVLADPQGTEIKVLVGFELQALGEGVC